MELDIPSVGKIYSECEPTVYGITTSQKWGYVLVSASALCVSTLIRNAYFLK